MFCVKYESEIILFFPVLHFRAAEFSFFLLLFPSFVICGLCKRFHNANEKKEEEENERKEINLLSSRRVPYRTRGAHPQ